MRASNRNYGDQKRIWSETHFGLGTTPDESVTIAEEHDAVDDLQQQCMKRSSECKTRIFYDARRLRGAGGGGER